MIEIDRLKEIIEAHRARMGEEQAKRALQIACCLRAQRQSLENLLPPEFHDIVMVQLINALAYEGPRPKKQYVVDMARALGQLEENM